MSSCVEGKETMQQLRTAHVWTQWFRQDMRLVVAPSFCPERTGQPRDPLRSTMYADDT